MRLYFFIIVPVILASFAWGFRVGTNAGMGVALCVKDEIVKHRGRHETVEHCTSLDVIYRYYGELMRRTKAETL